MVGRTSALHAWTVAEFRRPTISSNSKPGGNNHGGGGGHRSDIRLKEDIVPLMRLDDGIGLYRFRYKGSDHTAYVGVLAQEVMEVVPSAVSLGRNGYLQVDYDRSASNS